VAAVKKDLVDTVLAIGSSNGRVAALDREIPADRAAKLSMRSVES
jgi:hypothetical protein